MILNLGDELLNVFVGEMNMSERYEIPIYDKTNIKNADKNERWGGAYFSFYPVVFSNDVKNGCTEQFAESLKYAFYVDEDDVYSFLKVYLDKYFAPELTYNLRREDIAIYGNTENVFDWYGANFYTYESLHKIIKEMQHMSTLFKADYYSPVLDELKRNFWIYRMVGIDDPDYDKEKSDELIKKHIDVVLDFYDRFIDYLNKIMAEYPETFVIEIYGL